MVNEVRASISKNAANHHGRLGALGLKGGRVTSELPRAVVVIDIVVLEPDATDVGLNDAAAPCGNALVVNVTLPVKVPPTGAVVMVKFAVWPAVTVCVGFGLVTEKSVMVRFTPLVVPPPGVGVTTVIAAVPDAAISATVIAAVNCVALTNVVARGLPLKFATDVLTKFVPVSVRVNAAAPALTVAGAIDVSVGTGFPALIVKVIPLESVPDGPPSRTIPEGPERTTVGVKTLTVAVPTVAISAAVIAAVN